MSEIAVSYDSFRPKACAFFAGRAWYAGVKSGEKLGWVLFSQVLDDIDNISKCYQQNDPTSEIFSDIKDNDGGLIQIPEAGEIVALAALAKTLLVFGSNGVWQILGGENGFTASSYSVEKVTDVGCLFQKTVVAVEESIMYWSHSGIYAITPDATGFALSVKNITDKSLKTFFQSIPSINKLYADGKYNSSSKIVHWLYHDSEELTTLATPYLKNRVLALDVTLGSFYTYSIDNTVGPLVVSLGVTKETIETTANYEVISNIDNVLSDTDNVIVSLNITGGSTKTFKYLTIVPNIVATVFTGTYSITWSDYNHDYFPDWYQYNNEGVEMPAYVITGYAAGGVGPARAKTASYIHMFMRRTEDTFDADTQPLHQSGVLMQTRWDFTDNVYPGKWSDEVQVYRQLRPYYAAPSTNFEDGYPLVITKNKIRGRGKALQIKLSAQEGKDLQIVGWSTGFVGNTNV